MLQNSCPFASVFHVVGYMQQLSYPILWWLVTCNKGASLRWIELSNLELYHNYRNLKTFENVAKFMPKSRCIPR